MDFECLLVATEPMPKKYEKLLKDAKKSFQLQWIESPQGRALQMNTGAKIAKGDYFWFIHADSRLNYQCFPSLYASVKTNPHDLHYFKLCLLNGPFFIFLNTIFANWRADILGIPFGDQGFCFSRQVFFDLGGFDPHARYEDHHLVWKMRLKGGKLKKVNATLQTSARKYRRDGWFTTTIMHLYLTYSYAIPRWLRLVKEKYR